MNTYKGIMQGLGEALEHAEGKRQLRTIASFEPLQDYTPEEIKRLRVSLGMTQVSFAGFLGVSPKTVEAWESGRNTPEGPARRMFTILQKDPTLPEMFKIHGV